jgi:hypothetical protein
MDFEKKEKESKNFWKTSALDRRGHRSQRVVVGFISLLSLSLSLSLSAIVPNNLNRESFG